MSPPTAFPRGCRLEKARAVNQRRGKKSVTLKLFGDVAMTRKPGFGGLGCARRVRMIVARRLDFRNEGIGKQSERTTKVTLYKFRVRRQFRRQLDHNLDVGK